MAVSFSISNFLGRWIFAILLVFGTYNPTSFSFVGWLLRPDVDFGPVIAIVGLTLLICWIIFLRATFMSMGSLGIVLGAALLGCLVWLLVDLGWLKLQAGGALSWVLLLMLSLLLAIGMSWSHIRRRLTGQMDVDDLDDGRG